MAMTVTMMRSEPKNKESVWHFSLLHEPRGSPEDQDWDGAMFKMDGMSTPDTVALLRRIADRVEAGESLKEISTP